MHFFINNATIATFAAASFCTNEIKTINVKQASYTQHNTTKWRSKQETSNQNESE